MKIPPPSPPPQPARAYAASAPRPPAPEATEAHAPQAARPSGPERLVANVVPGRVEFDHTGAAGQGLSIYAGPGDRNAAATGVALGRVIDVSG